MTVSELYDKLSAEIPPALSMKWDNDGLQICPEPSRPARRVLCALDLTPSAVDFALGNNCDAILTHHPLLFSPLRSVRPDFGKGGTVMRLLSAGVAAMSFHTRYDALDGGMNDLLAAALGLSGTVRFGPEGEEIGRLGSLSEPLALREYAAVVKYALSSPFVLLAPGGRDPVERVAVCGGDAKDFIVPAARAGADLLVCGRASYNTAMEAQEYGISVLEAGHFNTEMLCVPDFAARVERLGCEPLLYISAELEAL